MTAAQESSPAKSVKRVGMVIGVKPEKLAYYQELHADDNPGVRDLLVRYHIRNFSIFLRHLDDGRDYLFAYYEYVGEDYAGDFAKLAAEPRNQAWLALCDPCQIPLAGEKSWSVMESVYHNP
jgi:L-rhamnose mutarotase